VGDAVAVGGGIFGREWDGVIPCRLKLGEAGHCLGVARVRIQQVGGVRRAGTLARQVGKDAPKLRGQERVIEIDDEWAVGVVGREGIFVADHDTRVGCGVGLRDAHEVGGEFYSNDPAEGELRGNEQRSALAASEVDERKARRGFREELQGSGQAGGRDAVVGGVVEVGRCELLAENVTAGIDLVGNVEGMQRRGFAGGWGRVAMTLQFAQSAAEETESAVIVDPVDELSVDKDEVSVDAHRLELPAEAMDLAAVALAGFAAEGFGLRVELALGLPFGGESKANSSAFVGLGIEGLGDGGGTSILFEGQYVDIEFTGLVTDVEEVAELEVARGFGGLAVARDAAGVAGVRGEGAGFEEACGPEPLVDPSAGHSVILVRS
jgi:hypothetical protein